MVEQVRTGHKEGLGAIMYNLLSEKRKEGEDKGAQKWGPAEASLQLQHHPREQTYIFFINRNKSLQRKRKDGGK